MNSTMAKGTSNRYRSQAGFTIIELLTALVVMGVGTTVLFQLYLSSSDLAESSMDHEVAADIAQEYLTTIQARPEWFIWPDYDSAENGEPIELKPLEGAPISNDTVDSPSTRPNVPRAYNRDRALYADFDWIAYTRRPNPQSNYVEILVEVTWTDDQRVRPLYHTGAMARPPAPGGGS